MLFINKQKFIFKDKKFFEIINGNDLAEVKHEELTTEDIENNIKANESLKNNLLFTKVGIAKGNYNNRKIFIGIVPEGVKHENYQQDWILEEYSIQGNINLFRINTLENGYKLSNKKKYYYDDEKEQIRFDKINKLHFIDCICYSPSKNKIFLREATGSSNVLDTERDSILRHQDYFNFYSLLPNDINIILELEIVKNNKRLNKLLNDKDRISLKELIDILKISRISDNDKSSIVKEYLNLTADKAYSIFNHLNTINHSIITLFNVLNHTKENNEIIIDLPKGKSLKITNKEFLENVKIKTSNNVEILSDLRNIEDVFKNAKHFSKSYYNDELIKNIHFDTKTMKHLAKDIYNNLDMTFQFKISSKEIDEVKVKKMQEVINGIILSNLANMSAIQGYESIHVSMSIEGISNLLTNITTEIVSKYPEIFENNNINVMNTYKEIETNLLSGVINEEMIKIYTKDKKIKKCIFTMLKDIVSKNIENPKIEEYYDLFSEKLFKSENDSDIHAIHLDINKEIQKYFEWQNNQNNDIQKLQKDIETIQKKSFKPSS